MAVDPTIIVVIALLVIYVVLSAYSMYSATFGKDLNPLQMEKLKLMLDYKVRLVQGGNWVDNFFVYMRNNHAILSVFFPTDYNPIQGSERVGILFMTAVASVAFEALKKSIWDSSEFYAKILLVTFPVLIVDYLLNYLATREEKALVERSKKDDAEWCDEEIAMRQGNLTLLITTRNERTIIANTSGSACMGQMGFKCMMLICFVLLIVFGLSGVSAGWLSAWMLSWAFWFLYAAPLFHISYCREEPFEFSDGADQEDIPSVAEIQDLTKEEVAEIVNEWSTHQCCYGQEGGNDIDVVSAVGSVTKKIVFTSWSEGRCKENKEEPYNGGNPVGWEDEREEPPIWDCEVPMGQEWVECTRRADVPGSARVVECSKCNGGGEVQDGEETEQCSKCKGSGKLLKKKVCVAFFGVRSQHDCLDVSECPLFVVEGHSGKETETMEKDRDDEDFHEMANQCEDTSFKPQLDMFHERHKEIENHPSARINKQKYCIQLVPLWEVKHNYGEEIHRFWIIGEEKDVYWPSKEYSPRCCHCLNCFDCNNLGKPKHYVDWC